MNDQAKKLCFRKAHIDENDMIAALYQSVIGQAGCTWNESYPGEIELREDFETENLYVLTDDESVIGAVSVVHTNELDELECWQITDASVREIARVVVDKNYQGQHYSEIMLEQLFEILEKDHCRAIHILVASKNIAAQKIYKGLGFAERAECDMFGNHYYAYEKIF